MKEALQILKPQADPRPYQYLKALAATGMRSKEIGSLQIDYVAQHGNRMYLELPDEEMTKTTSGVRSIPVPEGGVSTNEPADHDGLRRLLPSLCNAPCSISVSSVPEKRTLKWGQ